MAMSRSRCISPHERIDQVINEVENIIVEGVEYTAGCGIDITGTVITAAIDNTSIICADGVLSAVAASDLTAGCGIDITGGEVSASVDGTTIDCVGGNLTVIPQDLFSSVIVSGEATVTADSPTTALTLAADGYLTIDTDNTTKTITLTGTGDGVGYDEIQEEGTPLTKRAKLNFISERVTAADNAGAARTDVTFEYFIRVFGTTTDPVTAATSPFDVDGVAVIQGDMPELTAGELSIVNVAKIPISDETEAEFRWNQRDEQWETEPLKSHMVLGLATAGVTGGTFTIDNIELVCGSDPRTDPTDATETLSVTNPFAWDIDNNGQVLATKKANGDWIAIQAACPA